jgi:glycosyltransferase involved in cell wall biosynthesis
LLIIDNAMAFGGTLSVTRNLARHLDPKKIDVTVITACSEAFMDRQRSLSHAAIRICRPYANYRRTHKWYMAIQKRVAKGRLRKFLERLLVMVSIFANIPYSFRIAAIYVSVRAQIVHYNQPPAIEAFWIARFLRARAVLHLHGMFPNPLPMSTRSALHQVRAYIAISSCVHASAVQAGVPERLIYRIPNFVGHSPNAPPSRLPDTQIFGIFGRVIPWKGQKEFLEAAKLVMERLPNACALVVGDAADGDASYLEECVSAVRNWGLSKRVEFAGMVHDVASYYRRCNVVVHASIEPEPFGMVIIEAMAEGRPVVASAVGAGAEIVLNCRCGVVADPRDREDLSEKIFMLLTDVARAQEMGLRGFSEVKQHYDPGIVARKFEDFYRGLL